MITLRAALAIVLLFGVYLLALLAIAVTGALVFLTAMSTQDYPRDDLQIVLWLVGSLAAVVVVVGSLTAAGKAGADNDSVLVDEEEAPELWAFVRQVAAEAGLRPPAELRLNGEVDASVSEDARLLGLLPGRRRLTLGLPLLAALSANELRALLGHEFGHYLRWHTRGGLVVYRGHLALRRLRENLADSPARLFLGVFKGYTKLYARVSFAVRQQQEFEADAVAAHIAGPSAVAKALRSLAGIDARWQVFHEHLSQTAAAGHVPEDPLAMFALMLAERPVEVAEPEPQRHDPYAGHPGMADRLARLAAVTAEAPARPHEPSTWRYPRRDLLRHLLLHHDFDALPAARWLDRAAREAAPLASARMLLDGPDATLATVLDRLESGDTEAMAARFDPGDRHRAVARLCEALHALVGHYLVEAGSARWRLSWAGPSELVVSELRADGVHLLAHTELNGLVFEAVDHPSGVDRLRRHLASRRVDPKRPVAADPEQSTSVIVDASRRVRDKVRKAALFTLYVAAMVAAVVIFVLTDQTTERPVTGTTVLPTYTPPATHSQPTIQFQLPPSLYSSLFPRPPEPSSHRTEVPAPLATTDGNP
jgi:Zn-dependent protease with chaperone function